MSDSKISAEAEDEFKEAFNVYAKNGMANIKQLGYIMRYLGQNPTDPKLSDMMSKHGSGNSMTEQNFVNMMSAKSTDGESEESVVESFEVFDKDGKGYISAAELRHILTNLGDKLPDEQVNQMLSEALASDDGNLDYKAFVQMMINR
eukprot:TRINITY_DN17565_c1_g2_i1.p1 TRINITY_DN17565_c1_g2~~TRINITY_DN17565_c1_g2_i1.p1  ORF type:complete len:147 (+),score=36.58 TRINITY_DN17565_c1_g2_i1:21-461(+)